MDLNAARTTAKEVIEAYRDAYPCIAGDFIDGTKFDCLSKEDCTPMTKGFIDMVKDMFDDKKK